MNYYSREDVYEKTLEYFKGDAFSTDVWINKYALKDSDDKIYERTPDDMHKRISKELARIEGKYPNPLNEEQIFNMIKNFNYIVPQGSPMSGIGNNKQVVSLSNCFVIGNEDDSYGGIFMIDQEQAQLMKRRGGVGHDLSHIRPKGSPVKNSALTSTGIVPFMDRYSNTTREVAQDGRRGALMLSVSVKHPDVESFIDAKIDTTKITGANVSVRIGDDFMKAIEKSEDYLQQFPIDSDNPQFTKLVKPKKIWDKIIQNAWKSAEPGILFWDTIIKESVADSYPEHGFKTVSTNPSLRWDTKILTKDGIVDIKESAENNDGKVIVKNIMGEWKEGKSFKSGINKQLYKISFTNSSYDVYCTAEHKWPLINTNGQIINKHTNKFIKKETKNLNRLDKIYFPQFSDVINVDKNLTEIDGFVCGWNLGDGWVSYHKLHKSNLYGFLFSKEDCDNGIHNKVLGYINDKNKSQCKLRENKGCYEFSSSSKNIKDLFDGFGLTNKKNGLPSIVWKSNDIFVKGVIDGLFSSDGSVDDKRKIITFTSCHEKLAKDVHRLLSFYGIKSYLIKGELDNPFNKNKKSIRFDIRITNKSIIKFNRFFKLSNINKQTKIDNIIQSNDYGKYSKNSKILSNRDYLVIKSIEATDIYEDVYDITVYDDTHTFQTEVGITSNCGEITLCPYDSCRLVALNLYSFVEEPFTKNAKFNWDKFKDHVINAQRFMDDIIDLELEKIEKIIEKIKSDPESETTKLVEMNLWLKIKDKAIKGRRTGLGVTAEGDMLASIGLTYGTKDATKFSVKVHQTLAINAYKSSAIMAKERGAFPIYDYDKESESGFIKRIRKADPELDEMMKKDGRRNISILTIAPTGCLVGDTIVKTDKGNISMEKLFLLNNINIEDYYGLNNIWIETEKDISVFDVNGGSHKINRLYWNGKSNTIKINYSNGIKTESTPNHKFLIKLDNNRAIWKRSDELKKGDKIIKL